MSTFAIGDIHGNLDGLQDLLAQMSPEVRRGDIVVFLGDYVDRGPDSKGCVDAILGFRDSTAADVVCLLGNHEDWLLETRQDFCRHAWLRVMDGWDTIRSYSPEAEVTLRRAARDLGDQFYMDDVALPYELFFEAMPASHLSFFEELRTHVRGADGYCSHAGVVPTIWNLDAQPRHELLWGASGFPYAYTGDELIVYGHWNNATVDAAGWPGPRFLDNTIGLDTSAFGVVTGIRLSDRRVFQSAQYAAAMSIEKWKGR